MLYPGLQNPHCDPAAERQYFHGSQKQLYVVIGGIYTGIFTPTEAAGGAFGAFCIALIKRKLTLSAFTQCLSETGKMTAFIF